MASSLVQSTNPQLPNCLIGENYRLTLNQSLQSLLAEIQNKTPNFARFDDVFFELMQAKIDPPLESVWAYSALSFRRRNMENEDPLSRLSVIRDLFQSVSACSGSCNSSKSIALLAPVVLEVYKVVVELLGRDLGSKREKKAMKEVKSLVEVIVGYISVCCSRDLSEESSAVDMNLTMPVADLVSVWLNGDTSIQSFFPLMNSEICREISGRGFDVNYMAGMVTVEVFLLKLCLSVRLGTAGSDMEEELRSWAVCSITGFQSFYFFEILVRLLLESALPVVSLLSPESGILLRNILYDVVILVEYSFLNSERAVHLPAELWKSLAMARLIVTHEAIEFFRKNGNQKKATRYSSAFSISNLPSQIRKWVTKVGIDEKAGRSFGSSPKALIKWLLILEKQGINVFDDGVLKCHAKLVIDDTNADYGHATSKAGEKISADDDLFFIDSKGEGGGGGEEEEDEDDDDDEDKENESISAAFLAAAHSMNSTEATKKRKGKGREETKRKIKYFKYELSDNTHSARDKISAAGGDDSSSESEVENPHTDEEADKN